MKEIFPPNALCEVEVFEEIERRALAVAGVAHGEEESRTIAAAGLQIELRTNSPTVADEIEQSLSRAPKLRSKETCHVTIAHLRNPMSLGTEFKSLGSERIPTSSPVVLFSCVSGCIDVVLNVVSRRLLLITTQPNIDVSTIGHHAVRILLSSLGRGIFTAVHSAAVWHDRELILLVGGSGAGKSTTAARLVSIGYEPFADDVVFVVPEEGGVRSFSLFEYCPVLYEETVKTFPEIERRMTIAPASSKLPASAKRRLLLDNSVARQDSNSTGMIRHVLFVCACEAISALRRLSPAEYAIRFMEACQVWHDSPDHDYYKFNLELAGYLVEHVPCYEWSPPLDYKEFVRSLRLIGLNVPSPGGKND